MYSTLPHLSLIHIFPGHPDVGRELATDLVAQAQAQLAIGKARTDAAGGIVPAVQVDLGVGLEDQPVGQQDVVLALQAQRALAVLAEEGGDFRLEVVERQALHAERRPGLRRAGLEILAHAGDQEMCIRDSYGRVRAVGSLAFILTATLGGLLLGRFGQQLVPALVGLTMLLTRCV